MKTKVLIAIPTKGEIKSRTCSSLLVTVEYLKQNNIDCEVMFAEGTLVPIVRTKLIEEFNKTDFTHLCFIDSDQTFSRDYIFKLLQHDKDIITIPTKCRDNQTYNLYSFNSVINGYEGYKALPDGLIEVEACGFGLILIKRDVLQYIPRIDLGYNKSEDIWFCEKARSLNYKIFADCSMKLGHVVDIELR